MGNKDIEPFFPFVVKAGWTTTDANEFVKKVAVCIFVQNMDSPALAALFPVLSRGVNGSKFEPFWKAAREKMSKVSGKDWFSWAASCEKLCLQIRRFLSFSNYSFGPVVHLIVSSLRDGETFRKTMFGRVAKLALRRHAFDQAGRVAKLALKRRRVQLHCPRAPTPESSKVKQSVCVHRRRPQNRATKKGRRKQSRHFQSEK